MYNPRTIKTKGQMLRLMLKSISMSCETPQKTIKNPIISQKYLTGRSGPKQTSVSVFSYFSCFSVLVLAIEREAPH